MIIEAKFTEHGREAGKQYSVYPALGIRLCRYRRALFVRNEPGEQEWNPVPQLRVKDAVPKHDKMMRRAYAK